MIFCWAFLNNKCQFLFGWIWILHQIQKWRLFIHKWISSFLINFCILLAAIISFFRLFEASFVDEDWLWIIKFLGFAEEFSLAKPYVFIKNEGGGVLTFFTFSTKCILFANTCIHQQSRRSWKKGYLSKIIKFSFLFARLKKERTDVILLSFQFV